MFVITGRPVVCGTYISLSFIVAPLYSEHSYKFVVVVNILTTLCANLFKNACFAVLNLKTLRSYYASFEQTACFAAAFSIADWAIVSDVLDTPNTPVM